ncbi:MAG: MBL fold metallo-hydrolase [candidate division NC10 bacterium]|nr:MBL fold metallo-hydrolase [candidate division NC10 bacterium]
MTPSAEKARITYWGHATTLIELDGVRILTDPVLRNFLKGLRRAVEVTPAPADLLPLDLIAISHAHYDHLDRASLKRLPLDTPLLLPPGHARIARRLGYRAVGELRNGDATRIGSVDVVAVPAQHVPGRSPLNPRGTPHGFVFRGRQATVYFAGDTGFFPGLRTIGTRFRPDIALLPIGGYRPLFKRWLRMHLSPAEAVEAIPLLGARLVVPIHWGTFKVSAEPLDEPVRLLRELIGQNGLQRVVRILQPGESVSL